MGVKSFIIDVCASLLLDDWPLPNAIRRWLLARHGVRSRLDQIAKLEGQLRLEADQLGSSDRGEPLGPADAGARVGEARPARYVSTAWIAFSIAASILLILSVAQYVAHQDDDEIVLQGNEAWEPILASVSATKKISGRLNEGIQDFGQTFGKVRKRLATEWTRWEFREAPKAMENETIGESADSPALDESAVQSELENIARCLEDAVVLMQHEPDSSDAMAHFLRKAKARIAEVAAKSTKGDFGELRWSKDGRSLLTKHGDRVQCRIVASTHDNLGPDGTAWQTRYEFAARGITHHVEIIMELP